jgi:hypothetical protein
MVWHLKALLNRSNRIPRDMAGEIFQNHYITHAGLGVWDVTSDYKFTIEYISESYVGALLPGLNVVSGKLEWNNAGQIWVTTPTQDSDWLESQIVCAATGVAYNQLITYIQDNTDRFTYVQPVDVAYYNATQLAGSDSGTLELPKRESFWFVNQLVNELSTYGTTVASYLTLYATSFQYITPVQGTPAVVQWDSAGPANPDVFRWYQQLSACYNSTFVEAEETHGGGQHFVDVSMAYHRACVDEIRRLQCDIKLSCVHCILQLLKSCYGDYAYLYASDNSVYNVS